MTESEIINGVLRREGGWRDAKTRPDGTYDPPTNLGITLDTLRRYYHNPILTSQDLRELLPSQAEVIYREMYIARPGFTAANIPFEPLRIQLIDFGVSSGPERAVRWLQRVLRMPEPNVDGILGPRTIALLHRLGAYDSEWGYWAMNDALVAARSYMIDNLVDHGGMRKEDEEGVESRALSFFLAKP